MLLLTCFTAAACAAVRPQPLGDDDERLSSLEARHPSCVPEAYPEALPPADAVVDSMMLLENLRLLTDEGAPAPAGYVLLSLGFDERGLSIRRDVLEHSTPRAVADTVRQLVFAARRYVEESDQEWGVRLRVGFSEPITMAVGRREFCPPVARDREVRDAMHSYTPLAPRFRRGVREQTVHMRAFVSELGTITAARIVRGDLPGGSLERNLQLYLQQFLFAPATVDGDPTGAWIEIPVRVRRPA